MLNAEAKIKQKSGAAGTGTGFKKEQIRGIKTDGVTKHKQE
jgi:hypothetical protein